MHGGLKWGCSVVVVVEGATREMDRAGMESWDVMSFIPKGQQQDVCIDNSQARKKPPLPLMVLGKSVEVGATGRERF